MLAANNRDVARSADAFPDVATCVAAIERLQREVCAAVIVASRVGRADWSWRLRLEAVDIAVSSRTYQRRLQCEAACALFVELVPDATLVDVWTSGQVVPASRHRVGHPIVETQYGAQLG
jgi:hypothetical protein